MNKLYSDSEGNIAECFQLSGPMILNTVAGEMCGRESDWVILLPQSKPAIIDNDNFVRSFTETTEIGK